MIDKFWRVFMPHSVVGILQLNTKKRFVYGAIAFIWVVIPTIEITFSAVTTDVVKGTCVAFGVYTSYAMKQSIAFFTVFVAYFLPLALLDRVLLRSNRPQASF